MSVAPGVKMEKAAPPTPDLGYISLPDFDPLELPQEEGFREKFARKFKENPFVPIGLGLTVAALTVGLSTLKTGNTKLSQKMMRLRVAAQGSTVFAILGGVYYQSLQGK